MADFKQLIDRAVQKYGLGPEWRDIGYKQLMAESGGRPDALGPVTKSGERAQGAWQFMPKTAKGYGLQNPNDPAASTDAWGRMMSDLLKQTGGNPAHALAAYNWGIGNLSKQGMDKMPAETRGYLQKILGNIPVGTQQAQQKAYAPPAVNGVGAQDARMALQPKAAEPMEPNPQQMAYGQPAYTQGYGMPVDKVVDDQFIERV